MAPYLLMHGWSEKNIGLALFAGGITTLVVQNPIGQMIDVTANKRIFILSGNILVALTSIMLIVNTKFNIVIICICLQGLGNAMTMPALYGLTLELVGSEGMISQVPVNETCNHAGNAFYAIIGGVLAYKSYGDGVFWTVVFMGVVGSFCLLFVDNQTTLHFEQSVATGLISSNQKTAPTPILFIEIFYDFRVVVLLLSVLLFHSSNAAMLPLLTQRLALSDADQGLAFASICMIIAQLAMVFASASCAQLIPKYGTKTLILTAFSVLSLRGTAILLLLQYHPDPYFLLLTQVFDGISGGLLSVATVIAAEQFTRTTGRFNTIICLIKSCELIGAAASNLCGELIANYYGYDAAFLLLVTLSIFPFGLYSGCISSTKAPAAAATTVIELKHAPFPVRTQAHRVNYVQNEYDPHPPSAIKSAKVKI